MCMCVRFRFPPDVSAMRNSLSASLSHGKNKTPDGILAFLPVQLRNGRVSLVLEVGSFFNGGSAVERGRFISVQRARIPGLGEHSFQIKCK